MSPSLQVDLEDPTPPFEQLRRQLAVLITSGQLPAGDRLPPLRQLARDLGLAVGTVARTYRELEVAGLVRSRRGAGTTVAERAASAPHGPLDRAAERFALDAAGLGVDLEAAVEAVARAWTDAGVRRSPGATAG